MSNEAPKPDSEKKITKRERLLRRFGRVASGRLLDPVTSSLPEAFTESNVNMLADALGRRKASRESLGKGKAEVYKGSVPCEPLVARDLPDFKQDILTHLIFIGDSVLGISSVLGRDNSVEETTLSVLPIGKQGQTTGGHRNNSAHTLLRIVPSAASAPGPNGVVVPWKEMSLGLEKVKTAFGIEDNTISGEHCKVDLMADGRVEVKDTKSKNGTEVMTLTGLSRYELDETAMTSAQKLLDSLQAEPYVWSSQYADKQVVIP